MKIARAFETGCRWQLNVLLMIISKVPMGQTTQTFFSGIVFLEEHEHRICISLIVQCFLPQCVKGNIQKAEEFLYVEYEVQDAPGMFL